jgi:hypothetical protein
MSSHIDKRYEEALAEKSDIQGHLEYLSSLARNEVVVEFGFRTGLSAAAFLHGGAFHVHSYDVHPCEPWASRYTSWTNRFYFHQESSLTAKIQECSLLFIDSKHTYEQLSAELARHHDKVRQLIVMHDTGTFGNVDEKQIGQGLIPAIDEFLIEHSEWRWSHHFKHCNGLTVLSR